MTPLLVSHYAIDAVFPKVASYLAEALGTATAWTVADLATVCSNRGAFLFVDDASHPGNALVCRFETWGGRQVLNIIAMAGKGGEDWPEALDTIRDFAVVHGAESVVFHGRIGWQRKLPEARVIYQTYEIEA